MHPRLKWVNVVTREDRSVNDKDVSVTMLGCEWGGSCCRNLSNNLYNYIARLKISTDFSPAGRGLKDWEIFLGWDPKVCCSISPVEGMFHCLIPAYSVR